MSYKSGCSLSSLFRRLIYAGSFATGTSFPQGSTSYVRLPRRTMVPQSSSVNFVIVLMLVCRYLSLVVDVAYHKV